MYFLNTGLVLEGGGFRGVYTAGVLEFFMAKKLDFSYVIGASMGACNAVNYVSRQPGRNRAVTMGYVNDSRYLSYLRFLTRGEIFGMDFIFNTLPRKLVPFDYSTFAQNKITCIAVATDCCTGKAVYYEKAGMGEPYVSLILRASSSLPVVSKPVRYQKKILLDGGLSDAVPVKKSMADGNAKNVIVLTRPKGYRKKKSVLLNALSRLLYPRFHGLHKAMENRHKRYNRTMDDIDKLEEQGLALVIRSASELPAGRLERKAENLEAACQQGYEDAMQVHEEILAFAGHTGLQSTKSGIPR